MSVFSSVATPPPSCTSATSQHLLCWGDGGGKCSRDPGWEGFLEEEIVAGCFVHFISHRASLVITRSLRGGALSWYGVSASLPLGLSHVVLLSAAPLRRFPRPLEGYSSICHLLA